MTTRLRRGLNRLLRGPIAVFATTVVTSVALGGCSFSATFDSPPLYRLVAVNDAGLPAAAGFGVTILSGSIELGADGDCVHIQRVRTGSGSGAQESTWELECEWSRSGDQLEFTFEPVEYAASMSAVIQGERLVLTRDTGIRCVTTPCPAIWVEEYLRDRSGA